MSSLPPPRSWPVLGILPAMQRAPHDALEGLWAAQGDHATARVGPLTLHLLSDAEVCRGLLRASENKQKKSIFYEKLKPAFGDGLLTSGGEPWRRHRAMIQPLLTPRAVRTYLPIITRVTERLIEDWRRQAAQGASVDAAASSAFLAREVTVRALFGDDTDAASADLTDALTTMERWIARRFWSLIDPELFPSSDRRRHREAVAAVDRLIHELIRRRRAEPEGRDDVLARLVRARDETGALSERQLRDEVTTLYLAGQETTAQALTFTLWLLARHKESQERLRAEVVEVMGDGLPGADQVRHLDWTRACIDESMRLYPPVWLVGRETKQPLDLGRVHLARGSICSIAPWILHRRHDVWSDADAFRPERFLDAAPRRAYMPFGAGPRNCVGRDLALLELVLALAMLVRTFRMEDATPTPIAAKPYVSLKPEPAPLLRLTATGAI